MERLKLDLENCYGIRNLQVELDFSRCKAHAIYAANGAMKTSLSHAFQDISDGRLSKDRIFPDRPTRREIKDENDVDIGPENVLVIRPYDEVMGHSEKTSTLLVNSELREEYESLHVLILEAKQHLLESLKARSGFKGDIESEISSVFTKKPNAFQKALVRVKVEVLSREDTSFSQVPYAVLFDDKVADFLGSKDFKTAIHEYIKQYNGLLENSTYFAKGVFNFYNANTIAKSLSDNGFFAAKHSISLNAGTNREITTVAELEEVVEEERKAILSDSTLKKKFLEIEKLLSKNASLRQFENYLIHNEDILPKLANIADFKEEVWTCYLREDLGLYTDLLQKFESAEVRKKEIEHQASLERTQWEQVIEIFNDRFFVPFKLTAKNRTRVILGQEPVLALGFTFKDSGDEVEVAKPDLLQVLSTGEKKALYILNVIFEIEARKYANQTTILLVDDIADSFDYKNKYAIIEYLKEIGETACFRQIILTHNFDFFRTIQSRFVRRSCCLMATKDANGVTLHQAEAVQNVFIHDWKKNFFSDPKKRIASIPFIRNLLEFTKSSTDPDYGRLTSLLHWKSDSSSLCNSDLDGIFNNLFGDNRTSTEPAKIVIDLIFEQASACLQAAQGLNFENKLVLSIAIRLRAEQFMISAIDDTGFVGSITSNQTPKLLNKVVSENLCDVSKIGVLKRVSLMTPENIHINSFMYEPILDMSDEHLRRLYGEVCTL